MGVCHAEIELLLKESNIRNPSYFVFANTSMLLCWKHIVLEALYVHVAEVFAKTKQPGFFMLLSFNKYSISA